MITVRRLILDEAIIKQVILFEKFGLKWKMIQISVLLYILWKKSHSSWISARYEETDPGNKCTNKRQEIDSLTDNECKAAGEGLRRSPNSQYKWENVTGSEKLQWDGPGAFSACLITNHSLTVLRNPEPFKTQTNLHYEAICRASGNVINFQMKIKFRNIE